MKRWIFLLALLCPVLNAQDGASTGVPWGRGPNYDRYFWRWPDGTGIQWKNQVEMKLATDIAAGASVFYVDSNVSNEGGGSNPDNAKDTIEEGIQLLTANQGDWLIVLPGHAESGSAAGLFDLDVAGSTIWFQGVGQDMGTITYSDTDTTCIIGAPSCRIIGGRFLAGISEVVSGIVVEADANDCELMGCVFPEPTTSSWEFDEAITVASGADRLLVRDCIAYSADATGASSWIDLTAGVNNGTRIIGNTIHGEYSNAPIYSDNADLETLVLYNNVTNLTASQFCIEFTAAATGTVANNLCNPATVDFEVDPGSMMYWNNNEGTTLPEQVSLYDVTGGFSGDGGSAQDDSIKSSLDLAHTDLDAILADSNEMQEGLIGSVIVVESIVESNDIPNNTQTAGAITGASSGVLILEDILVNTDATGWAGPTNIEFSVDNTNGDTGAADPIVLEAIGGFPAAISWEKSDATSHSLPLKLETGKKVYVHGDDGAGTGAGKGYITLVFRRVTSNATIAGADLDTD